MKNDSLFDVKTQCINEDIAYRKIPVLSENLRYPVFTAKDNRFKRVTIRMNAFYKSAAERYSRFCHKTLSRKAFAKTGKTGRLFCAVMNYSISYCDENYICVIVDVSGNDGESAFGTRFAHTWSVETSCVLPASHFVKTDRRSVSYLRDLIMENVRKNSRNPAFGYYGDCEKRAKQAFSVNNFCILPKGLAFFTDPGVLSDVKYGPSVFVVPKDKADGVVKLEMRN